MTPGTTSHKPSLRFERELQRAGYRLVAGMDEVGRGALAGWVSVGVVVIDEVCRSAPVGVKDSKLLSPQVRERLVPKIQGWATAYAVGHASPAEIDRHGIMVALRLAGTRALAALPVIPDLVILDGNYDWLTDPEKVGLLGLPEGLQESQEGQEGQEGQKGLQDEGLDGLPTFPAAPCVPVRTMVKGDMICSSVAAASVLAKVERDAMMVALAVDVPGYAWELNKGYSAPEHFAALGSFGPSAHHRRSWRLPGLSAAGAVDRFGVTTTGVPEISVMHDDDVAVPAEQ